MASQEQTTRRGASRSKAKSKNEASTSKRKLAATTSQVDTASENDEKIRVKKQKRSQDASANTLGGLLSSGIEVASNAIQAVVETVGSFAGGGDKSLLGDATTVATAIAESNGAGKKPKRAKKAGNLSSGSLDPAGDGFEGFDGDEANSTLIQAGNDVEDDLWEHDTAALRKDFESGSEDASSGDEGFKPGQKLPKLPSAKNLSKQLKETKQQDSEPGAIYVGRIPHGFHEDEMREYFGQFGTVNHVRLSRNKRTGRSKHYAFLEFESAEVAKIVANTMDKYLMFGHILQCRFVPKENLHHDIWKGADKRFKKIPWAKIEARKLEEGHDREGWRKTTAIEELRRAAKAEKLRKIGYEFEAPKLVDVSTVPVKKPEMIEQDISVITSEGGDQKSLVVSETTKTSRKSKRTRTISSSNGLSAEKSPLLAIVANGSLKDEEAPAEAEVEVEASAGDEVSARDEAAAKRKRVHPAAKPAKSIKPKKQQDAATAHPMDQSLAEIDDEEAMAAQHIHGITGGGPTNETAIPSKEGSKAVEKRAKGKTEERLQDASADARPVTQKKPAKKQKNATKNIEASLEKVNPQVADALAGVTEGKLRGAAKASEDTAEKKVHAAEAVGPLEKPMALKPKSSKAAREIKNQATEAITAGAQAITTTTAKPAKIQAEISKASNPADTMSAVIANASNTARKMKKPKSKAADIAQSAVDQAGDVSTGSAAVANTINAITTNEPSAKQVKAKKPKVSKSTPAPEKADVTPTRDQQSTEATAAKGEKFEKTPTQKKSSKKRKASTDLTALAAVSDTLDAPPKSTKTKTTAPKATKKADLIGAELRKSVPKKAAKPAKKEKTMVAAA